MPAKPPIVIAGPTAVGKSAVCMVLAERLGAEILSADSMQVYRGMDIGTGKPTLADRRRVPHHLLDVIGLDESFDAARYVQLASIALGEIQRRHKSVILCGGTGLYLQALFLGLGDAPPSDAALRSALELLPTETLLAELHRMDPVCFANIDVANRRRVVRAVEVIRLTGKPFSAQRAVWSEAGPGSYRLPDGRVARLFGLERPVPDLQRLINERVLRMVQDGLVDEVKRLQGAGLSQNRTASQALGYKQILDHLQGNVTLDAAIEDIQRRTRQYAKRQLTWFRRQAPLEWIPWTSSDSADSIADEVLRRAEHIPGTRG